MCLGWGAAHLGRHAEKVETTDFTEHSWALTHYAAAHTYGHQDTRGFITVIQPEVGTKFWSVQSIPERDLRSLASVDKVVDALDGLRDESAETVVVQALPGDIL